MYKRQAELGAVPIFEHLRKTQESGVRLGILSGTVVLLPLDMEQDLKGLMEEHSCEGNLIPIRETGYGQLQVKGKNTAVVAVVTEFFTQGKINVLVGTKSLLGEGWDEPCINSLILATYVGSFMLSNQMRGRAIRIDRSHPEKTGNIWHLACVFPENEGATKGAVPVSYTHLYVYKRQAFILSIHSPTFKSQVTETVFGKYYTIEAPRHQQFLKHRYKIL